MKAYRGGCHCGQVRFEIETDLTKATECNCSICTKKGALHHRVPPERFKLLSGQDLLSLYQSGNKIAKHWFCKVCGIHPFSNPRANPDMFSVNIRCLDDYWNEIHDIEVKLFDGQNWEDAIKTFKFADRQCGRHRIDCRPTGWEMEAKSEPARGKPRRRGGGPGGGRG